MKTMESLSPSRELYDPIRKSFVKKTPEEEVRQSLLVKMIQELGYPLSLIAVEKELPTPKRRLDILCHALIAGEIHPLLLIECKAVPLNEKALWQVVGYNTFVSAPFIAIVNEKQILFSYLNL